MKSSLKARLFLFKADLSDLIKQNRGRLLAFFFWVAVGMALGIYIGIRIGGKEAPFGMFASLFHLEFVPFKHIGSELLRFALFCMLTTLAYFLPCPYLYRIIACLFFGKYFGQLACVVFLSDSFVPALLSALLLYVPQIGIGGWLLFRFSLQITDSRLCSGPDLCKKSIKRLFFWLIKTLLLYFLILFFLYVFVCGLIYLIVIAL